MDWRSRFKIPVKTQRRPWRVHHKITVRKLLLIGGSTIFLLLVLASSGVGERIGDKLVFYVRVARLYGEAPDSTLAMPLQDVAKKQIANTWHAPRGTDRVHEGQDIFAPKGTPIYSATEGYVYNVDENRLGGQTVSVIGAGGRVYYYAHLDSYAPNLAEGDHVTTQTVLGYVGTTGNAQGTPPHLHFGVYTRGGAINPLPLITDRIVAITAKAKVAKPKAKRTVINRKV
jgi:murein DD-endopeptidase MepM/ murein hydrolase activator NlpD